MGWSGGIRRGAVALACTVGIVGALASPVAAAPPGPGLADLTVTLTTAGQPVDNAQVLLCSDVTTYGADCIDTAIMDQGDGTAIAEFTGVAAGDYTLGVTASWSGDPNYRDFHTYEIGPVSLVDGTNSASSTVPTGGRVSGTVYGAGGDPVPFATLSFNPDPYPDYPYSVFQIVGFPTINADANGDFTTNAFPPGDYRVVVQPSAPGQGAATEVTTTISTGLVTPLSPALLPGGSVVGIVTDAATGDGVDGALIQVYQGAGAPGTYGFGYTSFGSGGAYSLGDVLPAADYFAEVSAPGYARQAVSPVEITAGTTTTVNFSLELGATITGTVFDGGGAVVPYADVAVSSASYSTGTQADGNGVYTVADLPAASYDVTASASGFLPTTVSGVLLGSGATTTQHIVLETPGSIQGTILDANGVGSANVYVSADQDGGSGYGNAMTVAGGAFTISDLPPGTYTVVASPGGGVAGVTTTLSVVVAAGGIATPTLQLQAGGHLELTVTDSDGDPIDAAMSLGGGSGPTFAGPIGPDGYLLTGQLVPGSYTLTVGPLPGQFSGTVSQTVSITSGNTTSLTVVLPDLAGVTGTITRTEAAPAGVFGAVLACPDPLDPLTGGLCGPYSNVVANAGGTFSLALTPGVTYNVAAIFVDVPFGAPVASSPVTQVTVAPGEVATCTFVTGPGGAASCATAPPPVPGTVVVHVDEPAGPSYYPGFCAVPGLPVLGSVTCTDGRPATILFGVPGGSSPSVTLPAGEYWAGMAVANPLLSAGSPTRLVRVTAGQTVHCSFTLTSGAVCAGGNDGDGDGIDEPSGYDGNGDGAFDVDQGHVTSLVPRVGAAPVTIASPVGTALFGVTATVVPASPLPPAGATFPVGVLGFSVDLGATGNEAAVDVHLPAGSNPNRYYKLRAGAWVALPTAAGSGSWVEFSGDRVTLHLVDGDAFDTDTRTGYIGDPGMAAFVADSEAPVVTCPSKPTFILNQPGASITATVTDAVSGPAASTVTVPVPTGSPGTGQTVIVTGADQAGNESTASCAFDVGYRFTGFSSPIDNGKVNTAKAGQAIPVKWRITDYSGIGVSDPASFLSVTSTGGTACDTGSVDAIEQYAGGSGLQYLGDGYWQFNWKTPKSYAGDCRRMRLNLADGTSGRTADFRFK